jgi:citrate synthase
VTTRAGRGAGGLEGVEVAETELSRVDGEQGRLVLRGHDLAAIAEEYSFEDAVSLLWTGERSGLPRLGERLGAARAKAHAAIPVLGDALEAADGMDALRAALAHAPAAASAVDAEHADPADRERREAVELLGAVAVFAAAWSRRARGLEPVSPDPQRGHAADYLRMVTGRAPTPSEQRALETYLVTVIDHGLNASTFTARVVASTLSDPRSVVVASLGALKGPLHGGAPGPVLDMLDGISSSSPAGPRAWLEAELAAGRRIMGMGHRVYRVRDPRAAVLERAAEALRTSRERAHTGDGSPGRLPLARAVEQAAATLLAERNPGRRLAANVEFYTAVLLEAVGLDRSLFSPTFAVSRTAGWLAHAAEQVARGRLLRPRARYVGPEPRARAGA